MIGVWSPELLAAMNQNQSEWRIESAEMVLHFHLESLNWNAFMMDLYIYIYRSYAGHELQGLV